ncbi:probable G-protein coupled receptor CG31760 [Daphnia carinata]|uniref:probable G-protein coupled receptor CG31760 n=1 Tax=Daphnia carinata TaxID=120202 RepID=UPI00257A2CB6|nr:probable G-protein coupled receptor CG31760 [Daphnia carinata]
MSCWPLLCFLSTALRLLMADPLSTSHHNGIGGNNRTGQLDDLLGDIGDVTTGNLGSLCISQQVRSVPVPVRVDGFESARQKADMLARLLQDLGQLDNQELLKLLITSAVRSERTIETSRIVTFTKPTALASLASSSPSNGFVRDQGNIVNLLFMAHAARPASPYADPSVKVDYIQQPASINASIQQQSTTLPKATSINSGSPLPGNTALNDLPWFDDPFRSTPQAAKGFLTNWNKFMINSSNVTFLGWWTFPYYQCSSRRWLLTYTIPVTSVSSTSSTAADRLDGLLTVDVSVSSMDINQCGDGPSSVEATADQQTVTHFSGTHKCHETSTCRFERGYGWIRGGYTCTCLPGYYSPFLKNATFNGSHVELAFRNKLTFNSPVYDQLYRCLPCSAGCDVCVDDSPCLAPYDWPFRIALLVISMSWVLISIGLMGAVYKYRRLKVFKVASPTFLCVTLLGCATMYAEMAAIFPELNTPACVATKWTRHMGFCITFSSLLMKTWRVSLTYRVKSAHKLKLTDQQLLQWMVPIMLVATVYLGAWTASDPPTGEFILTGPTMKFTQCTYNWWDHSLAIGEVFFLMWGIHVCYSVRHAETYFNETKHISWAVYNIAVTNIIFASFHLLLLPNVGPDMKYLLGFVRTQMSTTVTIALVFGPKFYLVAVGRGDEHDARTKARGVTASFSLNGLSLAGGMGGSCAGASGGVLVGGGMTENLENSGNPPEPDDQPVDLYRENEELKEQLQKLAGHMEFMKIVHMGVNNPHLKPKPGGYFSHGNVATTAAAAAVVSVAAATSVATATGPGSTSPSTTGESSLLQKRGASLLEPAVVHFNYESDVLLSRKSSSRQIQPSSLGVVVDDANVLDDSPTAELLPNSGPSKL